MLLLPIILLITCESSHTLLCNSSSYTTALTRHGVEWLRNEWFSKLIFFHRMTVHHDLPTLLLCDTKKIMCVAEIIMSSLKLQASLMHTSSVVYDNKSWFYKKILGSFLIPFFTFLPSWSFDKSKRIFKIHFALLIAIQLNTSPKAIMRNLYAVHSKSERKNVNP